ncbi:MAG TPA: aldo/keto reductase [Steroidobacteraceae bacterium]|nr:aldo/keto reductase [Steroidobacteraceae bacterium]
MSRLALGTVQFGLNYGVSNQSGQVVQSEVGAILNRAAAAGIDTLDTAIAYGESEACLGRAGVTGWRVITKLPPLPQEIDAVPRWVDAQIEGSLGRLGIAQLETVLLHCTGDLLGPHAEALLRTLNGAKAAGLTRSLGVSIYDPAELDNLWPLWRPEVVQAPCNVLDRRLIRSGWLDRLNRDGVRVHVRSVFLQGLLLMPAQRRPESFAPWRVLLDRWSEWCMEHEVSPLRGALAFLGAVRGVDLLVIGVDSVAQLEEVLSHSSAAKPLPPDDLFSEDKNLIEPSRWKLA